MPEQSNHNNEEKNEKPDIGDIIKLQSGEHYPVVGYEQGGASILVPCGTPSTEIDFCTQEFFIDSDDFEIVKRDPTPWEIYRLGMMRGPSEAGVKKALNAVEGNKKDHAQHILQTILNQQTEHEWLNGHLLSDNGVCQAEGCAFSLSTTEEKLDDDTELHEGLKQAISKFADCPATISEINDTVSNFQ